MAPFSRIIRHASRRVDDPLHAPLPARTRQRPVLSPDTRSDLVPFSANKTRQIIRKFTHHHQVMAAPTARPLARGGSPRRTAGCGEPITEAGRDDSSPAPALAVPATERGGQAGLAVAPAWSCPVDPTFHRNLGAAVIQHPAGSAPQSPGRLRRRTGRCANQHRRATVVTDEPPSVTSRILTCAFGSPSGSGRVRARTFVIPAYRRKSALPSSLARFIHTVANPVT